MSQLKQYWAGLQSREKNMVSLAAIVVVLVLAYVFIWEPWHKAIAHYKQVVPTKRADLKWMQAHQDIAANSGSQVSKAKGSNKGILTVMESVTSKAGVRNTIKQMSPGDKSNEARLWFTGIEFNKWLQLTGQLKSKENIRVKSANITSSESGIVDVRATFTRN